jgi:hypothetical protein
VTPLSVPAPSVVHMRNTTHHLVHALALVPGRRRLAARLGLEPRAWSLAAFPLAVLVVFLAWGGWLYPLRQDTIGAAGNPLAEDSHSRGAWGGPTLVAAWFAHAMAALGTQVVRMAAIRRSHARPLVEAS